MNTSGSACRDENCVSEKYDDTKFLTIQGCLKNRKIKFRRNQRKSPKLEQ